MSEFFDKDYFENGIATKKSCYENYRWIPELTYPMSFSFINYLNLKLSDKILEYGCAHGYFVKALSDFGFDIHGVDISNYAIDNCPSTIKSRLQIIDSNNYIEIIKSISNKFDYVISKDVFEHIPLPALSDIIKQLSIVTKKIFFIVPLGDDGKYRIDSYHDDPSHVIAENEEWWINLFNNNGYKLINFNFQVKGIKDKWFSVNQKGNGFFLMESVNG